MNYLLVEPPLEGIRPRGIQELSSLVSSVNMHLRRNWGGSAEPVTFSMMKKICRKAAGTNLLRPGNFGNVHSPWDISRSQFSKQRISPHVCLDSAIVLPHMKFHLGVQNLIAKSARLSKAESERFLRSLASRQRSVCALEFANM